MKALFATGLLAASLVLQAAAQPADVEFDEAPACRLNEIALGQPARIQARHSGARPACKCTRHLEYRFTASVPATRKIVFYRDGRVEGETTIGP